MVYTLGIYERDLGVSEAERKRGDDQINSAADTLCKAAGVFKHLAEVVIPEWEASPASPKTRPPELTRDVTAALAKWVTLPHSKVRRLMHV